VKGGESVRDPICIRCSKEVTVKEYTDTLRACNACADSITLELYNYIKDNFKDVEIIMLLVSSLLINYGGNENKTQFYLMQMKEKFEEKEYEV
jgi:hypothetical protein